MELNNFKTDLNKEEEGVWVDLDSGTRIKVARSNNKAYKKMLRKLMAPHKLAVRRGSMSDDLAEDILTRVIAETILLDWEGIVSDGEEIPYSKEKSFEILSDKTLKDFRDIVVDSSDEMDLYKVEEEEDAIKN